MKQINRQVWRNLAKESYEESEISWSLLSECDLRAWNRQLQQHLTSNVANRASKAEKDT